MLLAFDSFFQATVSFDGRLINRARHGQNVTLGRSERLNMGTVIQEFMNVRRSIEGSKETVPLYLYNSHPDFGMASAVYNGFSNISNLQARTVRFNCPTGNCTWDAFSSLSICSTCNDVSNHISIRKGCAGIGCPGQNCTTPSCGSTQDGTDVTLQNWLQAKPHNFTNYVLPYSHIKSFNGRQNESIYQSARPGVPFPKQPRSLMTINTIANASETISFRDSETLLASFLVMRASAGFMNNTTAWENSTPTATECALRLCINTYRARAAHGTLKETTVDTSSQVEPKSWLLQSDTGPLDPTKVILGAHVDRSLAQGVATTSRKAPARTDLQLVMNKNESLNIEAARFNISHRAIISTINFLLSLSASPTGLLVYPQQLNDTVPDVPRVSEALWNLQNLTATFENVAKSVTNYIRDASTTTHSGSMQEWDVHIRIRWQYMTLPTIAMLTGLIFVLLTTQETAQLGLPAWKEAALPVLAFGFDDATQKFLRVAEQSGRSESAAATTMVDFHDDGHGLRLRASASVSASS
jgi:hypothetical protein